MPAKKLNSRTSTTKVAKPKAETLPKAKFKTNILKKEKSVAATKKPVKATGVASKPQRTDVFISYSHADKKWLTDMQTHLKPLGRDHGIEIWDDTRLQSGDKWRAEIAKALSKAKVAILLVSPRFMSSAFIATDELPPLLQASEKEGLIILSVVTGRTGAFNGHAISEYQTVNDPTSPLNLMSEGQIDEILSQLYSRVLDIFTKPASRPVPDRIVKTNQANESEVTEKPRTTRLPIKSEKVPLGRTNVKKSATTQHTSNALLVKRTGEWLVAPVSNGSISHEVSLELKLTTVAQRTFVASLRQSDNLAGIVFRSQTYSCKSQDIQMRTIGTKETWHLTASIKPANRSAEITYSSITPDQQAEIRARLLLLDELPTTNQSPFGFMSAITQINGGQSPLPALYQQLNKESVVFKQAAPLILTWFLQTHAVIDNIHKLTLMLKTDRLTVRFEGERNSQYQNEPPLLIKIEGVCDLSKAAPIGPLRLYSINR
ncbi:TIR domain-containing protein [Spirosoma oryzae]|uniref:TIR domain-containing protein n=1 Tax=Spirosoma oryzae TaxID=1469603 RepID=A0A2T0RNF5_9BACT|nr:toll/interleukin-1 receptor domain-containing protein [Spirosoma oryzae]PRY22724.1 TIR domain-containing protein [Spirosoma oryzae]